MGGQGRPYSYKEQQKIVDYIREKHAFSLVKGDSLWKEMEPVFDGRTWQSLKEHYKKKVYPIINSQRFGLTHEEIKWFRDGFVKQPVHRQKIKEESRSVVLSDVHISDESDRENENQECEGATSSAVFKSSDKEDDILYDEQLKIKQESHSFVSSDVDKFDESHTEIIKQECEGATASFESSDRKDDVLYDEQLKIKQESHSFVSRDVHKFDESDTQNIKQECEGATAIFESSDRKYDDLCNKKINTSTNLGY